MLCVVCVWFYIELLSPSFNSDDIICFANISVVGVVGAVVARYRRHITHISYMTETTP